MAGKVSAFLCDHVRNRVEHPESGDIEELNILPQGREERVDVANTYDLDVRQNSVEQFLKVCQRRGVEIKSEDDLRKALDEKEAFVRGVLLPNECGMAIRRLRGRATSKTSGKIRQVRVSTGADFDEMVQTYEHILVEGWEEEIIDQVDDTAIETQDVFVGVVKGEEHRIDRHACTTHQRAALEYMELLLREKACGHNINTNQVRQKLKYLRQKTGWRLDPKLL